MAAVLFGFEDLLYSWDSLVWSLTSRALRTCRFGNLRVLQLMLKPWCISRAVYQNHPWFVWVSLPIHKPEHLEMKSAIADHHLAQQGSIEHVLF
ncbi:hypothetical protein Q9233_012927 [Columba guinea]|nr:hypothetical protein Q9233_012927 [Columba guinea]